MRDRKKRNIVIGVLCCLLVFMGVGYAILSQTLTINGIGNVKGNWDVEITSITLKSQTGRATEVSSSYTATTASFEADLYMPGDSIEYEVTVENKGNVDAVLQSITPTTTNKVADIKFSHSEIDNTPLTAGKTITFTMKVEFLESATAIPDVERTEYKLELIYIQYDGVSAYTPVVETTETDCFTITDDGTLLFYDKACGTDVVVPATIDNIPVERTANFTLATDGMTTAYTSDGNQVFIFMNQSKQDKFFEQMRQIGSTDEEISSGETNSYIYGSAEYNALNLMTVKDYLIFSSIPDEDGMAHAKRYKVSKDSTGTVELEQTTSSDYNVLRPTIDDVWPIVYYCSDDATCNLLKEYYSSHSQNAMSVTRYGLIDNLDYTYFDATNFIAISNKPLNKVDFSQAIYMDSMQGLMDYNLEVTEMLHKIVMPPNLKDGRIFSVAADEIEFPANSTTEVIGQRAIHASKIKLPKSLKYICSDALSDRGITKITIPATVVGIGSRALYGNALTTVEFESGSSLKYIEDIAFSNNQLTNAGLGKLPSSLTSLATNAFSDNSNLTQITLTSPTDIDNWPNGGTVNGITVTYER